MQILAVLSALAVSAAALPGVDPRQAEGTTSTSTTTLVFDVPVTTTTYSSFTTITTPTTVTVTTPTESVGYGSYCATPGAYLCIPDGTGETWSTGVGVCTVLNVVVEHTPCGSGTVCKKRTPEDASIYCVPPEFQFCGDDVPLPPANGTFVGAKRDNGTCYL